MNGDLIKFKASSDEELINLAFFNFNRIIKLKPPVVLVENVELESKPLN